MPRIDPPKKSSPLCFPVSRHACMTNHLLYGTSLRHVVWTGSILSLLSSKFRHNTDFLFAKIKIQKNLLHLLFPLRARKRTKILPTDGSLFLHDSMNHLLGIPACCKSCDARMKASFLLSCSAFSHGVHACGISRLCSIHLCSIHLPSGEMDTLFCLISGTLGPQRCVCTASP